MNTLLDSISPMLRGLLENSAKAALLACAVGLFCLLMRRWVSPGWRHALWCAVFVRLILPDLPLPGWRWNVSGVLAASTRTSSAVTAAPFSEPLPSGSGLPDKRVELTAPQFAIGDSRPAADIGANSTLPLFNRAPLTVWQVLAILWLSGTAVWWTALFISWWRFKRGVLRASREATAESRSLLASCLAGAGVRARVDLRTSSRITNPAVCGMLRHVILLPHGLESSISAGELRLLLLHEVGHVKRRDSAFQVFASLLLGLHWWNPLVWVAWHQIRNEAEAATDAWVLHSTDAKIAPSYGAMLLTLASRTCASGMAVALLPALIGVGSRGRRLKQRIRDITAPRGLGRGAAARGIAVMVSLAAVGFSQDVPKKVPDAKPGVEITNPAADTISGTVVDEKGQPIAGAEITIHVNRTRNTATKSVLPADYKNPAPVMSDASGRWQFVGVPAGVVPSTLANVAASRDNYHFLANHPEFLFRNFSSSDPAFTEEDTSFRQGTAKLVLQRGFIMRGVVQDEAGQPVAAAVIQRNPTINAFGDPLVTADAQGRYEMKNARPGNLSVRVRADGFGTHLQRVNVSADTTQDFTLKKAQTLTLKIRDDKDQPVKAYRDQRTPKPLVTIFPAGSGWKSGDRLWWSEGLVEDGVVVWKEAPVGELTAEIEGQGFTRVTRKVTAGGGEILVNLSAKERLPTVTLKIADADTGDPLHGCTINTGTLSPLARDASSAMWLESRIDPGVRQTAVAGEYKGTLRADRRENRHVFCVRREGYTPFITEPADPARGEIVLEVRLRKAEPVDIVVRDASGDPVAGASVLVGWQSSYVMLRDFAVRDDSPMGSLEFNGTTSAQGLASLPPCAVDAAVLVTHEKGFAVTTFADLARNPIVTLGVYAQVEGNVKQNDKPAQGVNCEFFGTMEMPGGRTLMQTLSAVSDAQGHVSLPRVIPVRGGMLKEARKRAQAGRGSVMNSTAGGYRSVPAGKTTVFDVEVQASRLRTLTGKLVLSGGGVPVPDRDKSFTVYLCQPTPGLAMNRSTGSAQVDDQGRFTFEGALPGDYTLEFKFPSIGTSSASPPPRFGFPAGKTSLAVSLPEFSADTSGKPVDLGDVEVVDLEKK